MQTVLRRQLFEETSFDSGALGLTTSVIHQFAKPGVYAATVMQNGRPVGEIGFEVDADAADMQLDLDLASIMEGRGAEKDCGCGDKASVMPTVSPKGYVLFHATRGGGWSAVVGDARKPQFDTRRLGKGDLFALVLMEPARYTVENTLGKARGTIEVGFSKVDARKLPDMQPVTVEAGEAFRPEAIRLTATQGLVFQVGSDARIVIARQGKREPEPKRGPMRFARPRPAEPKRGARAR